VDEHRGHDGRGDGRRARRRRRGPREDRRRAAAGAAREAERERSPVGQERRQMVACAPPRGIGHGALTAAGDGCCRRVTGKTALGRCGPFDRSCAGVLRRGSSGGASMAVPRTGRPPATASRTWRRPGRWAWLSSDRSLAGDARGSDPAGKHTPTGSWGTHSPDPSHAVPRRGRSSTAWLRCNTLPRSGRQRRSRPGKSRVSRGG